MILQPLNMRDIFVDTSRGNVLPTSALARQVSRNRFQNRVLRGVRMPEVTGLRCRRFPVCCKAPFEKFPLKPIASEFGAMRHELFTIPKDTEEATPMKSTKARRITGAFAMTRLSGEKMRTKRPGRTGFHRREYARILRTM